MPVEERLNSLDTFISVITRVGHDKRTSAPVRLFRGQSTNDPLLPRFAREADKRGLSDIVAMERRLLDDFSRLAIPYVGSVRPQNRYEWLAVAQHHGVPTRLLDWTGNPLFALWFAVRKKPSGTFGTFWVLHVQENHILPAGIETDVYDLKRTYVFRPAHITSRIVAQDGWFTLHWYIQSSNKFVPLEEQPRFKEHLKKYLIPAEIFTKIRKQLESLGISDAVLFPDLPNLSKELVRRFFPPRP